VSLGTGSANGRQLQYRNNDQIRSDIFERTTNASRRYRVRTLTHRLLDSPQKKALLYYVAKERIKRIEKREKRCLSSFVLAICSSTSVRNRKFWRRGFAFAGRIWQGLSKRTRLQAMSLE